MQIEIDSRTEELLEKLGAKDAASRELLIREALERTFEVQALEDLPLSEREREAIGAKLVREAEMAGSHELTDAAWADIAHGPVTEEELDKPFSAAVPPEWEGRTPRELREAKKQGSL